MKWIKLSTANCEERRPLPGVNVIVRNVRVAEDKFRSQLRVAVGYCSAFDEWKVMSSLGEFEYINSAHLDYFEYLKED
jgi:hypothetical protein